MASKDERQQRKEFEKITTNNKMGEKMKALFYDGPFKVSVQETDMPKIKHPDDVIIKVTTSCICGSTYLLTPENFLLKNELLTSLCR